MMGFHYHRGLDAGDITLEGHMIRLHLRGIPAAGGGVVDPMKFRDDYMKFMEEGSHGDTWVSLQQGNRHKTQAFSSFVCLSKIYSECVLCSMYICSFVYSRFICTSIQTLSGRFMQEASPCLLIRFRGATALNKVWRSAFTTALSIVAWKGDGPWTNVEGVSQTPWMY